MIATVLRNSFLDVSKRNLSASLTSINAVLFHHLDPAAARVSDLAVIGPTDVNSGFSLPPTPNSFGVKAREFHCQSGSSGYRASMVSPAGYAISESSERGIGDSESGGSSGGGDGLAISELGISPEIVKALSSKGIEKLFPIQKAVLESRDGDSKGVGISKNEIRKSKLKISPENIKPLSRKEIALQKEAAEESTSRIKGTKICIVIRSFDNPEKQAWCLPPHTRKVAMPDTRTLYTVLRSPHVDKKSREQFEMRFKKRFLVIKAQSDELSKKLFWLKRYRILGAQYELQFHCKTRLDMTHVLGNIDGSSKGQ